MVFANISYPEEFRPLSQQASAEFLAGGAAFYEALAALEEADFGAAATAANAALDSLSNATTSFSGLSKKIQARQDGWLGDATRSINFHDAARTVHLDPDSPLVKGLTSELANGNIHKLFDSLAQEIADFSKKLKGFADRAADPNVIPDDEYRLAHELLRDWGVMIAQGQYISSVCLAATTVKSNS
jgi:hypothetical protein